MSWSHRTRGALAAAVVLALAAQPGALAAAAPAGPPSAVELSRTPIAQDAAWQRYVLDQDGPLAYPKAVALVGGSAAQVVDPEGLKAAGGAVTTITSTGPGTPRLDLDLGLVTGGTVEVGIARTDGTPVHLGYSESLSQLTPNGDSGVYPVTSEQGVPIVTDPSLGSDDNPTARFDDISAAGDFRSPAIRGAERWISLQLQGSGTVSIDYVRVRVTHLQPTVADYAGHFLSSDDQLNRVFYAAAHTLANDAITRPDGRVVYVDGAKRDRLMWVGDLAVQGTTGDQVLAPSPAITARTLQAFSCQQYTDGIINSSSQITTTCPDVPPDPTSPSTTSLTLPEYTASWVIALQDHTMATGDTAFARRMLPVARRAMASFTGNLDGNGLYATPEAAQNWHPFDPAGGEDGHTNAVVHRGLGALAALEDEVGGGPAASAPLRRAATALAASMVAHLWDPAAGAFLLNATDPLRNHSQDAQVEAVYGGVVTGARAASALRFLATTLASPYGTHNSEYADDPFMTDYVSPYISGTELLARLSQHDTAGALALARTVWGHMVDTDPHSDLWEKVAFDGDVASYGPQATNAVAPANSLRGSSSYAHGWSTLPIAALSDYVGGIRPTAPGYAAWLVEPQPGDLASAQTQVPAPSAPVVSRWVRGAGDSSFVLTAGSTTGTGTVAVPVLGAARVIAEDGRVVWDGTRPTPGVAATGGDGYVRFTGITGTHTWAWSSTAVVAAAAPSASTGSVVRRTSASPVPGRPAGLPTAVRAAAPVPSERTLAFTGPERWLAPGAVATVAAGLLLRRRRRATRR